MPGCCISRLVILEKISTAHLNSRPGLSLDWSYVPYMVPKSLTSHGQWRLDPCCLNLDSMTSLALAWNGMVQMDSSDNVRLCWLPGLPIIWNKSWLLKGHMAHAQGVKLLKVRRWGIQLFDHSRTPDTSIFTQSSWMTIIMMLCTLLVSTQSTTSSGIIHSAMSIGFGSLMNCISCSWV